MSLIHLFIATALFMDIVKKPPTILNTSGYSLNKQAPKTKVNKISFIYTSVPRPIGADCNLYIKTKAACCTYCVS